MAAVKMKVTIVGHKELMRKLRADNTLAPPMRTAYEEIGKIGEAAGRSAAPSGSSGQLRAKLTHRVMGRAVATSVSIRTTATRSSARYKRYPYPKRLEYDPRSRRKGWLRGAIQGAWGRIQGVLSAAERGIEHRWQT